MDLNIGDLEPDFSLRNQRDDLLCLQDYLGKKNILLYFYPKASTPGCTTQACGIRDHLPEFDRLNTIVLGVSPDEPLKLQKFMDKHSLNFDLLADVDHQVAESYGVWGLKKFMGREFMGILRTSFIINELGRLAYITPKVNTKTHDKDILLQLNSCL